MEAKTTTTFLKLTNRRAGTDSFTKCHIINSPKGGAFPSLIVIASSLISKYAFGSPRIKVKDLMHRLQTSVFVAKKLSFL